MLNCYFILQRIHGQYGTLSNSVQSMSCYQFVALHNNTNNLHQPEIMTIQYEFVFAIFSINCLQISEESNRSTMQERKGNKQLRKNSSTNRRIDDWAGFCHFQNNSTSKINKSIWGLSGEITAFVWLQKNMCINILLDNIVLLDVLHTLISRGSDITQQKMVLSIPF